MSDRSGGFEEAGAPTGLGELYRLYSGWLASRLRRRFGDETDDLVQEAYVRAATYSRRGVILHPKALLLSIVENLVIDRARRKRPLPLTAADRADATVTSEAAGQAEALLLKQLILALPPHLREVFVLSRFAHMEYEEIGERLGIPVTTVQRRMTKALAHCATQLRL